MDGYGADSESIERLQDAIASARGTATTPDESVRVVVGANGALHSIYLEETAKLSARQLAEIVVELHEVAMAKASATVQEAIQNLTDGDASITTGESVEECNGEPAPPADLPPVDESVDEFSTDASPASSTEFGADGHRSSVVDVNRSPEVPPDLWPSATAASPIEPRADTEPGPASDSQDVHHPNTIDSGVGSDDPDDAGDEMLYVIEPFDTRDDDDDRYFVITADPPAPRTSQPPCMPTVDNNGSDLGYSRPNQSSSTNSSTSNEWPTDHYLAVDSASEDLILPEFSVNDFTVEEWFVDDSWGDWDVRWR